MRYIKFQISNFKFQIKKTGFTLIELLIVIALLGALAVGLLATVDPFEQLKKGTDTSTRNTVSELYNAFIRYYSVKNNMPWTVAETAKVASASDMKTLIQNVADAGELKPDFIQLAGGSLDTIYITSSDSNGGVGSVLYNNVAVCFSPNSKSFSNEPNAKYNSSGVEQQSGCKSQSGSVSCYWCIK